MAQRVVYRIPEGSTIACTLSATTVSTDGDTVTAYAVARDGTATALGSQSGAAAAASIALALDFSASGITAGQRYTFQVASDGTPPVLLVPNQTYSEIEFLIVDGASIT